MRRNRKISKRRSVVGMHAMHAGVVMLTAVIVIIINLQASSSCNQLMKSIGQKDAALQVKAAELDRATARWEAMTSTDSIDRLLGRRGIVMTYPKTHRLIEMDERGSVVPNQRSVEVVLQRRNNSPVARVAAPQRRSRRN